MTTAERTTVLPKRKLNGVPVVRKGTGTAFWCVPAPLELCSWATLHLDGHSEERPSSAQPYLGGCYRTGSE